LAQLPDKVTFAKFLGWLHCWKVLELFLFIA